MWPTILTLVMYPVLLVVYYRLAKREETAVREEFGSLYDDYVAEVPAFFPGIKDMAETFHLKR